MGPVASGVRTPAETAASGYKRHSPRAYGVPPVDEEYLTVHEVAALLRLNQQTARNWI